MKIWPAGAPTSEGSGSEAGSHRPPKSASLNGFPTGGAGTGERAEGNKFFVPQTAPVFWSESIV